jgi:hypothetical protein
MATKMYNSHLSKILSCNEYYILDTYINLVHISSEVNDKYLIQTFSDKMSDLINLIRKNLKVSYKTVFNCLEKLINLNVLIYDGTLNCWLLKDMENMTKAKTEALDYDASYTSTGYTNIRKFFFSEEFTFMKAREKRLLIYMSQLKDSKKSAFHTGFSMNLLKPNSSWLNVLKTKSKYYAKYTICKMLSTYSELFEDNSDTLREKDYSPERIKNFKFAFDCKAIKDKTNEDTYIELVIAKNPKEYELVMDKIRFAQITLSKKLIMHLIRAIANLKEWFLKERIVQLVVNKYRAIQVHKSRENIKSLPAYAAAVVKSVVGEYKNFIHTKKLNKNSYETGEYFNNYMDDKFYISLTENINKNLALLY